MFFEPCVTFVFLVCLQPSRFQTCCENGFKAALALAERITGTSAERLEDKYRKACGQGSFGEASDPAEDEILMDELEEENDDEAPPKNECVNLLNSMQTEAQCLNEIALGEDLKIGQEEPSAERNLLDKDDLESMLASNPDSSEVIDVAVLPSTLREAMARPGDLFNALWRLAVRMRSAQGGCDTLWIPHAANARKASRTLNWHQSLGCGSKLQVFTVVLIVVGL